MSSRRNSCQPNRPNGNSKPMKRKAEQEGSTLNNQKKTKESESARDARAQARESKRAAPDVSNKIIDHQHTEPTVNGKNLSGNKFLTLVDQAFAASLKQTVLESKPIFKESMRGTASKAIVKLRKSTSKNANPPRSQITIKTTVPEGNLGPHFAFHSCSNLHSNNSNIDDIPDDKTKTSTGQTGNVSGKATEATKLLADSTIICSKTENATVVEMTQPQPSTSSVNQNVREKNLVELNLGIIETSSMSSQQAVSGTASQLDSSPLQHATASGISQIVENVSIVKAKQSQPSASSVSHNNRENNLVKLNLGIPVTAAVSTQQDVNGPESQPDISPLQEDTVPETSQIVESIVKATKPQVYASSINQNNREEILIDLNLAIPENPEASTQQAVIEPESQPDPSPLQQNTDPGTSQIIENIVAVKPTPPDVSFPLPPREGLFKTLDDPGMNMADFKKLDGIKWIGDPVVDHCVCSSAMKHLTEENLDQIYIAKTQFFTKLQNQTKYQAMKFSDPNNITYLDQQQLQIDCASVQKWTNEVPIFSKKVIVIPVNTGDHWMLALVINPAGVIRNPINENESGDDFCHIIIIDSLVKNEELRKNHARHIIINWLKRTFVEKQVEGEFMESQVRLSVPANLPKQPNTTDCGIYAIFFADTVFSNIERFFEVEETRNLDWDFLNPRAAVEMEFSPREVLKSIILENAPEDVMEKMAKFYRQKSVWDWIQKLDHVVSDNSVVDNHVPVSAVNNYVLDVIVLD